MNTRRVLFLCTGNSARSQMAEGLVREYLPDQWEPFSAGTSPSERVHPLAVRSMAELGIDISSQRPKSVNLYRGQDFDIVITLCDDAAKNCPAWLGQGHHTHVGFSDPAAAQGSGAESLKVFRQVRKGIRERVFAVLGQPVPAATEEDLYAPRII
jgi:arsenate reductase